MASELPSQARVVIIGGGVVGCSVAYHLTKLGWRDVVLLERKQLTCGTTWHAAGLVGQLRATQNLTRLAQYTTELYQTLERETGQATGFSQPGSLSIATTAERFEELQRQASMARCFGLEVEPVSAAEIKSMWPLIHNEDLRGGVFLPKDGKTNPIDTAQAMAKGARSGGAQIIENCKVIAIQTAAGRVTGVVTEQGEISAEYVVNCGGMWAREVGQMAGVNVPLHACEHFYIVTEPMQGVAQDLPVLRDPDGYAYYKEDAGKLLVGAFEPNAKPWGMEGIPEDFCFDSLPEDWDHFEPILEAALHRVPALGEVGIKSFFNGPESFTPDDRYMLGEAPNLKNFFVAAGFNSIGIQSAGGAGKVLSEWIVNGHPPMDLWDVELTRMLPFQGNPSYLKHRASESLGLLYAMHWPFYQNTTSRGVRRSVLHDRLSAVGACFGEVAGWERANWFAPTGVTAEYHYSYQRQNWFEYSALEHRAVREGVGVFDMSSFGKFMVQGADAESLMSRVCANDVAVAAGKVVYTQWLNERGGIEADLTVTRLSETEYLVVTAAGTQYRDLNWLRKQVKQSERVGIVDVTSAYVVLSVMGPSSRRLLQALTDTDLSNQAFPFGTSKELYFAQSVLRASRISYVGELGWELYIASEYAMDVYDALCAAGEAHNLVPAGLHALNSLRIEKAYRHWGHDITIEDTPLEAGLGFAVAYDKRGGFIGRDSLLKQKEKGVNKRLVQFMVDDPEVLLYHDEPIWRDGVLVGYTTSGMYGHSLGAAIALGYVNHPDGVDRDFVMNASYEIEIAGKRVPARHSLRPLYDPGNERLKI